jgi:hypothetical protein
MNETDKKERAEFNQAVRGRIALIAAERGLPKSEIAKVMGRLKHYDLLCFAQKHRISLDWLIAGDLKGLLKTARSRRMSA